MGNISKIAALTALITLAFGITAISVTMAEEGKARVIMRIEILSDNTAKVVQEEPGLKYGRGNKELIKQSRKIQGLSSATILWSNPGWAWVVLDGRWYWVQCYQR